MGSIMRSTDLPAPRQLLVGLRQSLRRLVLMDSVGVDIPGLPIRDFFALDARGVADYSFHDGNRFYVDPTEVPAEQLAALVALACQDPKELGLPVTHWTPRELAAEAIKRGIVEAISERHVGRFLKSGRSQTASESLLAQ